MVARCGSDRRPRTFRRSTGGDRSPGRCPDGDAELFNLLAAPYQFRPARLAVDLDERVERSHVSTVYATAHPDRRAALETERKK